MSAPQPTAATISLDSVVGDERAWPRDQLDEERVELFVEILRDAHQISVRTRTGWTDPLPPLVVVADGEGRFVLGDGWHRYTARRRLGAGFDHVAVQVHSANGRAPAERAYELALVCAAVSAKPLTSAEKRAAIARLISERPELSDRAVARLVGVSHTTVGVHRAGVVDSTTSDGHDTTDGRADAQSAGARRDPLSWEVAAERLADDVADLLGSCQKLFGGADHNAAGRELWDALADLYEDDDALTVIDDLTAIAEAARAYADKDSS